MKDAASRIIFFRLALLFRRYESNGRKSDGVFRSRAPPSLYTHKRRHAPGEERPEGMDRGGRWWADAAQDLS